MRTRRGLAFTILHHYFHTYFQSLKILFFFFFWQKQGINEETNEEMRARMGWELMQAPAPPGAQVLAAHPCATWPRVMGRQTGREMKTRGKRTTACPQPLQPRLRPRAASGWLTLVPGKRPGSLSRLLAVAQPPEGPCEPVSSSGNRGTCRRPSHLLPVT